MLDCYLIEDSQKFPNSPGEGKLEYIVGFSDIEIDELKRLKLIEPEFDFYSDFRWSSCTLQSKLNKIPVNLIYSKGVTKFKLILEKGIQSSKGIIGYCD